MPKLSLRCHANITMNLNKVFLIGRLTQNPEMRTIPSGQAVCTFSLATSRTWTNNTTNQKEEKTEFHNIVLWRRLAEIASQYLTKGSTIMIEGRIQTRSWQDKNGIKKYRTEIIGENMQMGPKLASQGNYNFKPGFQKPAGNQPAQPQVQEEIPVIEENTPPVINVQEKGEEEEIDVKDIPF